MKDNYTKALNWLYKPNACMRKKFPKAAKKMRILKKWENRFGKDLDFSTILYKENPLVKAFYDGENFSGVYDPIPIAYSIDGIKEIDLKIDADNDF